jgi:sensor histidine kinase regulating citrate/malate metabolism
MVVVMLVVMTLFFMMSTLRFQTTLTHLVQSRLTVLAESVADPLEAAIDLGLSLSELRNADSLITRARENDIRIDAVDIFDLAGQILFSTSPERLNEIVEPEILEVQTQTDERKWSMEGDTVFSSGVTLTDNLGQTVGGVLFTYSKAAFSSKISEQTRSLIANSLITLLIFCGIAFFAIRRGFHDLDRYVDRIDEAMRDFPASGNPESSGSVVSSSKGLSDPDDLESKVRAAGYQIARATREINTLESTAGKTGVEEC